MKLNTITGLPLTEHAEPIAKADAQLLWPSISDRENDDDAYDDDEDNDDDSDDDDGDAFEKFVPIIKSDNAEHIVSGIVYSPNETDLQNDRASAEEIRKAAYRYMESGQVFKTNHKTKAAIKILESYLAPTDLTIAKQSVKKGSWILTIRVLSKKVWDKVVSGELTGFSMAGKAERVEAE